MECTRTYIAIIWFKFIIYNTTNSIVIISLQLLSVTNVLEIQEIYKL